jgi:hypothetical protein
MLSWSVFIRSNVDRQHRQDTNRVTQPRHGSTAFTVTSLLPFCVAYQAASLIRRRLLV